MTISVCEEIEKAAQLLRKENGSINEVCYMVTSFFSYFTKCFLVKQFGILPKDL